MIIILCLPSTTLYSIGSLLLHLYDVTASLLDGHLLRLLSLPLELQELQVQLRVGPRETPSSVVVVMERHLRLQHGVEGLETLRVHVLP